MNPSKVASLLPHGWPHSVRDAIAKKAIAENVIEEVLSQIADENREPTKWECDALSNAMGAILFGSYVLAVNNSMACFLSKEEVSRPAEWWTESEEQSLHSLRSAIEQVKGYPPRFRS